ncbi:30S ribosomal protein S13 [Listeria monocytogenes]|nr:30S ribosomal protein S13 [Listeria monocytogenes]GAT41860.1 30S ribosomal protein S13 [Listeria monocytogenes]
MFKFTSRRRSPSTLIRSKISRILPSSSSVKSRVRVSSETPASARTSLAVCLPIP